MLKNSLSRKVVLLSEGMALLLGAIALVYFVGPSVSSLDKSQRHGESLTSSLDRLSGDRLSGMGAAGSPAKPVLINHSGVIGSSSHSSEQQQHSLQIFNQQLSNPGVTLLPQEGNAKVLLVNHRGDTIHSWDVDATRARLLPGGNLLVVHGTKWGVDFPKWAALRNIAIEYDWTGKEIWRFEADDMLHHDIQRLENGNTLVLKREMVPTKYKVKIANQELRQQPVRSDAVFEVTPDGEIMWTWRAHDELDLNSCGAKACKTWAGNADALKRMKDWTHINTANLLPENQWYNEGDERFKPGNLIVLPRNWWTVFIVDRESGHVVWEYTGDYKGGVSGGHEAHMIAPGLPGAGNILLFDNGRKRHAGESYVLEINPQTKQVVWMYDAGKELFSEARGSVQRLPNGNTLISEDKTGRCFEVTPTKEIVWQYQSSQELNRCVRYPESFVADFLSHTR